VDCVIAWLILSLAGWLIIPVCSVCVCWVSDGLVELVDLSFLSWCHLLTELCHMAVYNDVLMPRVHIGSLVLLTFVVSGFLNKNIIVRRTTSEIVVMSVKLLRAVYVVWMFSLSQCFFNKSFSVQAQIFCLYLTPVFFVLLVLFFHSVFYFFLYLSTLCICPQQWGGWVVSVRV